MSDSCLNDLDFYSFNSMWSSPHETPPNMKKHKRQHQPGVAKKLQIDLSAEEGIELSVFKYKEIPRKRSPKESKPSVQEDSDEKNNYRDNFIIDLGQDLVLSLDFKPESIPNESMPLVKCYDLVPYQDPTNGYKIRSFSVFFYYDSYFFERVDINYFGNKIQVNRKIEFVFLRNIHQSMHQKSLGDSTYKVYQDHETEPEKEEEFNICVFLAAMISPFF